MYKLLLILRYLRRKLAPLFAALAVTLCTAMVIIVISVMGGFLNMMRSAARTLTGDVTIRADLAGFPHYEELMADLHKLPEVAAATPIIKAYGLVNLEGRVYTIEVQGIDGPGLDAVTGYGKSLYWTTQHLLDDLKTRGPLPEASDAEKQLYELEMKHRAELDLNAIGLSFAPPPAWSMANGKKLPGVVPGIEVSPYNRRNKKGLYDVANSTLARRITVTVLPLTQKGTFLEPAVREMVVVNEFKSGLYDIDDNRVYVPFTLLQQMLKMDPAERIDFDTGEVSGDKEPGRTSEILVRGRAGVELAALRAAVEAAARKFVERREDSPYLEVRTWEEVHATLLGAVEKEKGLVTMLFVIISIVAVAMIAVIFYMIVLEKTRDIGTLRALGASAGGVALIFLGYGLTIGILGGLMGIGLAAAVVFNINEIQDFLGAYSGVAGAVLAVGITAGLLGLVVGFIVAWHREQFGRTVAASIVSGLVAGVALTGLALFIWKDWAVWLNTRFSFVMWNREVYYFDKIPNRMDPAEVVVIFAGAVLFSVIGSVVPALLAARVNPVESLRYE